MGISMKDKQENGTDDMMKILEGLAFFKKLPRMGKHKIFNSASIKYLNETDQWETPLPAYNMDYLLVLQGKVDITFNNNEDKIELQEGDTFDPLKYSKDIMVETADVPAGRFTRALVISNSSYLSLNCEHNCYREDHAAFIIQCVPSLCQFRTRRQSDVISLFKQSQFVGGSTLVREGELTKYAYLIYKGECKLIMSRNKYLKNAIFREEYLSLIHI
eukprot:TRINITY_DN58581_c0_g1_i2.p1 TRINITY_DN58581_c0_g1~~TRINITY_DN58581_c0_g1_i2.p1  ORF type:complete len:217 (-),score=15.52 TRINITY_DN58581_c0_g1_i2:167-817(-)